MGKTSSGETTQRGTKLRVPTTALAVGEHLLTTEASHYVTRVHRKHVGDLIELFDPESGTYAPAVITSVQGRLLQCEVAQLRTGTRCGCSGLHLVLGMSKGDKTERVARDAVALGAASVSLVQCSRSVVRLSGTEAVKRERLVRVAVEAARQCGRSNIPDLYVDSNWSAVWERYRHSFGLVLHPAPAAPSIEAAIHAKNPLPSEVVIYVGPEGGLDEHELAALQNQRAVLTSLGELVLRTELAAVVALARVAAVLAAR